MKFYVTPGVIGEKELADLLGAHFVNHTERLGGVPFLCYNSEDRGWSRSNPCVGWSPTDEVHHVLSFETEEDRSTKSSLEFFVSHNYTRIESRLELAKFLIANMCSGTVVINGKNTIINTRGESYTLSVMEKDGGVDLKYQAWGTTTESHKGLVYFGPGAEKVVSRIPKKHNQSMITLKGLIDKDR